MAVLFAEPTATELALPYRPPLRACSPARSLGARVLARGRSVIKAPRHDRTGHAGWRPRNIWIGGQGSEEVCRCPFPLLDPTLGPLMSSAAHVLLVCVLWALLVSAIDRVR